MQEEGPEESTTTAFTALVIANLAASVELSPSFSDNAELCLTAGISSSDPGTVALTTLALSRLGLWRKAELALRQLMTLAVVESDIVHWGKPGTRHLFNLSNIFSKYVGPTVLKIVAKLQRYLFGSLTLYICIGWIVSNTFTEIFSVFFLHYIVSVS